MTTPNPPRVLLFGREPAVIAELIASLLVVLNLFLLPALDDVLQAAINAVVLAAASVYVAVRVKSDNLLPVLIGFFKVAIALIVTLGIPLTVPQQAAALTFIALLAGIFVRSGVDAPVTADGSLAPERPAV